MTECILNNLDIYSSFTHSCRKCMSKRVTAKMWEKHFWIFCFQKLLIIAITDNTSDCLIQSRLMLRLTEAIKKYKICISIYCCFAVNPWQLLSLLFHNKCFSNKIKHWNLPVSRFCLWRIYIEVAAFLAFRSSMVIINQCMINVYNSLFQINVAPSESSNFSYILIQFQALLQTPDTNIRLF